ncbi:hypothetical protein [Agitococcus lubricus]|uniref:Uncharacterized protein n=1 Tax=Agitococcus lubricus TaxID=1077255 RepID=A0A2T5IV71_9GAMM|nr:hypothetical protein [Agitococcus lubricus]PTQ87707.1 hypothetical protein C8N29_11731 [Agitococcus lubricus]
MTMAIPIENTNPYGFGANTLEQLQRYLQRTVNNICFASEEDLYAAMVIESLQQQIEALQQEISTLKQQQVNMSQVVDIQLLKAKYEYEKALDSQRLEYCMTHEVLYADGQIYANLETEEVIDGDYRAALDKIMGALNFS